MIGQRIGGYLATRQLRGDRVGDTFEGIRSGADPVEIVALHAVLADGPWAVTQLERHVSAGLGRSAPGIVEVLAALRGPENRACLILPKAGTRLDDRLGGSSLSIAEASSLACEIYDAIAVLDRQFRFTSELESSQVSIDNGRVVLRGPAWSGLVRRGTPRRWITPTVAQSPSVGHAPDAEEHRQALVLRLLDELVHDDRVLAELRVLDPGAMRARLDELAVASRLETRSIVIDLDASGTVLPGSDPTTSRGARAVAALANAADEVVGSCTTVRAGDSVIAYGAYAATATQIIVALDGREVRPIVRGCATSLSGFWCYELGGERALGPDVEPLDPSPITIRSFERLVAIVVRAPDRGSVGFARGAFRVTTETNEWVSHRSDGVVSVLVALAPPGSLVDGALVIEQPGGHDVPPRFRGFVAMYGPYQQGYTVELRPWPAR